MQNLYISENQTIDSSKVSSVTFNPDTNNLEVEFTNDFSKYTLPSDATDFEISNNKLIIKNLEFYIGVNLSNDVLANLQKNIQSFINLSTNQFSSTEFTNQITSDTFKDELARVLSIQTSQIGTITFTNDILKIQPVNMQKFVSSQASSLLIDNNIQVSGFNFFSSVTLTSPQNLYNFVNNYIVDASRKYTKEEFSDFIKTNNSQFKLNIAKSLTKQNGGTVSVGEISSISLNSDNNLVITLDGSQDAFFKYSVSTNNNVVVENGSLVVKNLTYYLDLTISDQNLQQLWTNLNNYIIDNEITIGDGGDIGNYLNYGIYNLFKNVVTEQNGKLEQFINAPTNIGTSNLTTLRGARDIKVTLKNGLYKMNSKNLDNNSYLRKYNIVVSNYSTISMNNLYLSSPKNYFNWNDTEITGLSSVGVSKTVFIIPYSSSKIKNIFYNNKNVSEIDMSFSRIIKFDNYNIGSGIFEGSSLKLIFMPSNINQIGTWNFFQTSNLSQIVFPNNLTSIPDYCFAESGLRNLEWPSQLTSIGIQSFNYCKNLTSSNDFPNTLKKISFQAFRQTPLYTPITLPSSITSIGNKAFEIVEGTSKKVIYAPNQTILNLVTNSNSNGVNAYLR